MQSHRSWFHRILVLLVCTSLLNLNAPLPSVVAQPGTNEANTFYLPLIAKVGIPTPTPDSTPNPLPTATPTTTATSTATPTPTATGTPPTTDNPGWVNGTVYDSVTCNIHLTQCTALAGVRITLSTVDTAKLTQLRAARKAEIVASGYSQPLAPLKDAGVTTPIPGEVTTDNNGAFRFPVAATGAYWLRAEKNGYTYGQRQIEIVQGRSTATNAIYLTPLDSAVTTCTTTGCQHTSSDGSIQLNIPPGAIPSGENVAVTATNFKQVEFLPSGDLPEGTWETYAFNLGGDSEYVFQPGKTATIQMKNDKGFAPGTIIPLGYWNQATQQWEHAGTGRVDASGQWVDTSVAHFSNYDINLPIIEPDVDADVGGEDGQGPSDEEEHPSCKIGESGCFISYKSGTLQEWINLPPVQVLNHSIAPQLRYSTDTAKPSEVIDISLKIQPKGAVEIGQYVGFELYIEGEKTTNFTLDAQPSTNSEVRRYRYLWDGRDVQGNRLPPGVYEYKIKLSIPYKGQYCFAQNNTFGSLPDCVNGPTNRFVDAIKELWINGTVTLDNQTNNHLGSGWIFQGQQRLYRSNNDRILISDGKNFHEFLHIIAPTRKQIGQSIIEGRTNPESIITDLPISLTHSLSLPLTIHENLPGYQEIPTAVGTDVSGYILTDTTWTLANSPYVMTGNIIIHPNATLTIEDGVIVKASQQTDFVVNGRLVALDTNPQTVIFTSLKDDSYGGDTNKDGTATTPRPGDWYGIRFTLINQTDASVNLENIAISYSNIGVGIGVRGVGNAGINISDNIFLNNFVPVRVDFYGGGGEITVSRNQVLQNVNNGIVIAGEVTDLLKPHLDVPLILKSYLFIREGGVLVLAPGTIIKGDIAGLFYVYGGVVSRGTAESPVIFTSIKDDAYGGDTNNDGTTTAAARGDWPGIEFFESSFGNVLSNCLIAYGRQNVVVATKSISIIGCTLEYSQLDGLYVSGDSELTLIGNNFISNGDSYLSYGLFNLGNKNKIVSACHNWWGDTSGPYHRALNPNGKGNRVSDGVVFSQWKLSADELIRLTATDHSSLTYDPVTKTYTRLYPDGTQVHFNTNGTHDYTLSPDGRKTLYTYNTDGSLATMGIVPPGADSARWLWTFNYTSGKLSSITDPASRTTSVTIDANGDLVQVTTPDQATRRFAYDSNHLLVQETNQNGAVTDYAYDSYGRIKTVTEPARAVYNASTGATETKRTVRTFTPSDTGYALINDSPVGDPANPAPAVPKFTQLIDRVVYERGQRSGHTNRWGSWLDMTDGAARTTVYTYDTANNLTREVYPNGECVTYTYDTNANLLTETYLTAAACTSGGTGQTWRYTYESRFNQIKTETDPLGHVTTYIYDYEANQGNAGHLIRVEYPQVTDHTGAAVTPKVSYSYNALGLLDSETDQQGLVTKYIYTQGTADEASSGANARFAPGVTPVPGLLTQIVEDFGDAAHLNLTTTYRDFDAQGNAQTESDPRDNFTRYTFDALGRTLTMTDPLGEVTKYEYDSRGNLTRTTIGYTADDVTGRNLVTQFTYDAHDRLLSQRTEDDSQVQSSAMTYDGNGKLATYTNSEGRVITYGYDDADQLAHVTDPLGQMTQLAYSGRGQVSSAQLANNTSVGFVYDASNNPTNLTPPGRTAHRFDYTARNEIAAYRPPALASGATDTTYTYDALGQITAVTRPDGKKLTYLYDGRQRLRIMTLSRGQVTYVYNPSTIQLIGINAPSGINLAFGYDRERRTSTSWSGPFNGSVSFAYDAIGRATGINVNNASPIVFQYDTSSHLIQAGDLTINRLRQNRQVQSTVLGQVSDAWSYDAFGKPTRYQATVGGTPIYRVDYSYDALNRIATRTELSNGNTVVYAYRYDAVGRLTEVTRDGVVVEIYGYDANGNRLTDLGGFTETYDAQDRLLTYGNATYGYTANGERSSKTVDSQTTTYVYDELGNLTDATLPNGTQIEYLIDGQNRRIGKKMGGTLVQGFLYENQLRPAAELDGTGNIVSRFIYGDRINVPEYMVKGGVAYRLILDHLGSVRLVVNAQTGAIAQRLDYDAFGKLLQDSNPGFQPFGFAGGVYDVHTGLVRFGVRDYDASTGRWTAKDPIRFGGGANLYAYALNNPVNFTDPNGLIIRGDWIVRPKTSTIDIEYVGFDKITILKYFDLIPAGLLVWLDFRVSGTIRGVLACEETCDDGSVKRRWRKGVVQLPVGTRASAPSVPVPVAGMVLPLIIPYGGWLASGLFVANLGYQISKNADNIERAHKAFEAGEDIMRESADLICEGSFSPEKIMDAIGEIIFSHN
jgi:RHS repeat-associated protein